jgi:hypothetical protein
MEIYVIDEAVYKLFWASDHPANIFRNLYKLFIGVCSSQIAYPNYKYLNINEGGKLGMMQWAILIKLPIGGKTQLHLHCMLIFCPFCNWQYVFTKNPSCGGGKERSELLTFTDEIFFRGLATEMPMKMQTCEMRLFSLLIWSVGKRGLGMCRMLRPPRLDLSEVAVESLSISFELTRIWNAIDRFTELHHYLLFDSNVCLFLFLQYCLHFAFVKRPLIEPYKGRHFCLSVGSMKMCLQVSGTVYTPQ